MAVTAATLRTPPKTTIAPSGRHRVGRATDEFVGDAGRTGSPTEHLTTFGNHVILTKTTWLRL
ncbi:hypothetical protein ACLMAJ_07185 [Nocardia sp. KC 131]|uniref:hypothetical protein n=1 Tax=Nocardia arseniciresistens TaxID=3392119 RepID=UPI00398F12F8